MSNERQTSTCVFVGQQQVWVGSLGAGAQLQPPHVADHRRGIKSLLQGKKKNPINTQTVFKTTPRLQQARNNLLGVAR